ncbi:hypothetical protein AWENTII_010299 [Aspergillus wentii]
MSLTTGTLVRDNIDLYYELRGTGPPLLLIPGGYGTCIPYTKIADHLSARFRVITLDRRGYLRSKKRHPSRSNSQTLFTENAHDIAALLQTVTREPVLAFASSFGTYPSIELLRLYPSLIRKLIIHDPVIVDLVTPRNQIPVRNGLKAGVHAYRTHGGAAASTHLTHLVTNEADHALIRGSRGFAQMRDVILQSLQFLFDEEVDAALGYVTDVPFLRTGGDAGEGDGG